MFGFGKNNRKKNLGISTDAVKVLYNYILDELSVCDAEIVQKAVERNHPIASPVYFMQKMYSSIDVIAYKYGFLRGFTQSLKLSDKDEAEVTLLYGQLFDYMISQKRIALGFSSDELNFRKNFEEFIVDKTFENDEEAMKYMLAGLAEGSAIKNSINNIGDNYSSM